MKRARDLESSRSGASGSSLSVSKSEGIGQQQTAHELPAGKSYAFFCSHKKSHSRFGDASADLARATKVSQSILLSTITLSAKRITSY